MSNNDHIARSGSWAEQKKWAVDDSDADCILELRARVERLEQAQQQGNSSAILTSSAPAPSPPHAAIEALRDAISALRYIEQGHGRLYGVGWDRVFDAAAPFLAAEPEPSSPAGQGELVRSVAEAMDATPWVFRGYAHVDAAILAVADWFAKQGWGIAATMLRREVGR